MKRYRLWDIPRGKRLAHFWLYYKWHLLGAVLTAVTLAGMLRPLWAGRVRPEQARQGFKWPGALP